MNTVQSSKSIFPTYWSDKIDAQINASLQSGLSGAVVTLVHKGERVYQKAYGYQRKYNEAQLMPDPQPMTTTTLFDVASLTKIFSTTLAYHMLVDKKEIRLDEPASKYLPNFGTPDKKDITIQLLLQHNSGMKADFAFYDPDLAGDLYSQSHAKTIEFLGNVPLASKPGTTTLYSDLNFVALGAIIEKVSGMSQADYVAQHIYAPLGLKNTGYMLMKKGHAQNTFEATTRFGNTREGRIHFPNIRTTTIQGEVQDETAYYAMEQVSGNAGLFSSADDICVLAQLILNGGSYGSFTLCSSDTVKLFRKTYNIDKTYALGWELVTGGTTLLYGYIPPLTVSTLGDAVAHTGWTGKCFIIDFEHESIFLLLTNKKHSPLTPLPNYYNHFEGDFTPAGKYGNIADLFYGGLVEGTQKQ